MWPLAAGNGGAPHLAITVEYAKRASSSANR
jgi:hypothetical protein